MCFGFPGGGGGVFPRSLSYNGVRMLEDDLVFFEPSTTHHLIQSMFLAYQFLKGKQDYEIDMGDVQFDLFWTLVL